MEMISHHALIKQGIGHLKALLKSIFLKIAQAEKLISFLPNDLLR
jgi:hypothetical protein